MRLPEIEVSGFLCFLFFYTLGRREGLGLENLLRFLVFDFLKILSSENLKEMATVLELVIIF